MISDNEENVQLVPAANDHATETDDFSDRCDPQHEQKQYDDVLQATLCKVNIVITVSLMSPFLIGTRHIILEIYMAMLSPQSSTATIAFIIGIGYVWYAIFTFIATSLGDSYGHDMMLLFAFVCNTVGVFVEAIAPNLLVFSIGFFVNRILILNIATSYILYMLPHKNAVIENRKFNAIVLVVFLCGPMLSGFMVDYTNYRTVFWLNAIILALCTIITIVFIVGSQTKLHTAQRSVSRTVLNRLDEDEIFPICKTQTDENHASWQHLIQQVPTRELCMLLISTIQNALSWECENITTYYIVMMLRSRFGERDISLLEISAALLSMMIPCAVVSVVFPRFVPRVTPNYLYLVSWSSVFYAVLTYCVMFVNGGDDELERILYWILWPCMGVLFGVMETATMMCMMEIQPKKHSGKVNAVQAALNMLFAGLAIWFVGYMWTTLNYNAFWLTQSICTFLVFVLSVAVWCLSRM